MSCYMGQEPDPFSGRYRWVIPVKNPCQCKEVHVGSLNTRAPSRPFNVTYYDTFLRSSDPMEIGTFLNCTQTGTASSDYPVINEHGARWRLFWWWTGTVWPGKDVVNDVLQDEYGDCESSAPYCFSRLPGELQESSSEMLGIDSAGNVYRWTFNPSNDVAHAVWQAFHDHQETKVTDGNEWSPVTVAGLAPIKRQDSFHYREEHGVKSLQIDDDNCDCYTSLSLGHGMCFDGHTPGSENVYGVDLLYDIDCQEPIPSNSLRLYFRDDDECATVTCPIGYHCVDGVNSFTCVPSKE
ncbi:uncharacterized protein LOC119740500 [Patiria miniata]|uniref:Uncharacterized protein n=1 Tax=Patiria miniata TaxID=46514 RepID=A0A914B8K3_PATMI|nr:uncharacterized protein LOC119740500 [Patiria miniata]